MAALFISPPRLQSTDYFLSLSTNDAHNKIVHAVYTPSAVLPFEVRTVNGLVRSEFSLFSLRSVG